jgi:hypothetical protein
LKNADYTDALDLRQGKNNIILKEMG